MHPALLAAMSREIPRLQAQESLRRVTEIALGNGLIEKRDRDRIMRGWQADAGGEAKPAAQRLDLSRKSALRTLAAFGIPMEANHAG